MAAAVTPGAVILAVLGVISLASLALILAKAFQLRGTSGSGQQRLAALEAWAEGRGGAAGDASPAGRVLGAGLAAERRGLPRRAIEGELERLGNAEVAALARGIRTLEVIAVVAPLLGLLGTVLGMIVSFRSLEAAGGSANAAVLAGGIWQALLTTAAGLLVAIPAAAAAALLSSRIERIAAEIEDVATRFFVLLDTPPELRRPG